MHHESWSSGTRYICSFSWTHESQLWHQQALYPVPLQVGWIVFFVLFFTATLQSLNCINCICNSDLWSMVVICSDMTKSIMKAGLLETEAHQMTSEQSTSKVHHAGRHLLLIFHGGVWMQRVSTYRDIFRSNQIAEPDQPSALKLAVDIRSRNVDLVTEVQDQTELVPPAQTLRSVNSHCSVCPGENTFVWHSNKLRGSFHAFASAVLSCKQSTAGIQSHQ